MKSLILPLLGLAILGLQGCSTGDDCTARSVLLLHPSANWKVDVSPGNNFEDYVGNYREWQKAGQDTVVPYLRVALGSQLDSVDVSLAPIKRRRVSRFAFDARAVLKITHGSGSEVSVAWKENNPQEVKHRATYDLSNEDQLNSFEQQISDFYRLNSGLHGLVDTLTPPDFPSLGLPVVARTYYLEVRVESKGNDMTGFEQVVGAVANGYATQVGGPKLCSMSIKQAKAIRKELPLSITWASGGKFNWEKILKGE